MAFERYLIRDKTDPQPSMSVHLLRALLEQFLTGGKSSSNTRLAIEEFLTRKNSDIPVTLTTNDTADITAVINFINNGADLFEKKNRMDEFYRILICTEARIYWVTRTDLRTKLNWSDID